MTVFRHKCPTNINPKTKNRIANGDYSNHIRREYEVPGEVEWQPIYDTGDARFLKMGILEPTGREMAFVTCPDCNAEIVITRTIGDS